VPQIQDKEKRYENFLYLTLKAQKLESSVILRKRRSVEGRIGSGLIAKGR
jgi:hypothetical protein